MGQLQLAGDGRTSDQGRPRASRGPARRREIMAAAEDVFLEHGYGNATMDDIAARASASKATMYKQFGSKEAMFAEIVHSRVPDIADISTQALQAKGKLSAVLANWSLHVLKMVTAPRAVALYKLILAESPRSPELTRIFYERGPATAQAHLAEYFQRATAEGRLNCRNPKLASTVFTSAVFGEGFERALLGLAGDDWYQRKAKAHVQEAIAMFLARYGT